MAEKTSGKKDQQKNKKQKQNENKKNQSNHTKHVDEVANHNRTNSKPQKKKPKTNKSNSKTSPVVKKKSDSFLESFFMTLFFSFIILGFLYIVDYEKFVHVRDGAGSLLNKAVNLLPASVVAKGKETLEIVRPTAENTAKVFKSFINETSTFLNTNPLIKDHWANVRDIGSICCERLVDYMRTLYLQITSYCNLVKTKVF